MNIWLIIGISFVVGVLVGVAGAILISIVNVMNEMDKGRW